MRTEGTMRRGRWLAGVSAMIAVVLSLAGPAENVTPQCPLSHGYWKTHAEAWPVHSLVLGNPVNPAHTYVQSQLLVLLAATGSDASVTLARQLIAAKLNVA